MSNEIKLKSMEEWKEYKIIEIFDIERGKRLKYEDREKGNVNYFSATESNNGLTDKISNPLFIRKNRIIYSTFGDAFYVAKDFTASDEITMLSIKRKYNFELNKYVGLFLVTVLKQMKVKFLFGRKAFINKYKYEYIKLPSKNNEPNWEYMEEYIKSLENKYLPSLSEIKKPSGNEKIELKAIGEWEEYEIRQIFDVERGKRIVKEDYQSKEKKYKVITAKTNNNGIDGTYDKYNADENILTVCGEVSGMKTYYQKEKTWVLDTVRICEPKFELNKYIAMFLIPIFEKNMNRYGFGKKLKLEHLRNTVIKLPSKNNEPDWEYMEEYIKSLPYSNKI